MNQQPKKVAFIVGMFPVVSETFIINQVADLIDRGVDVQVFSFRRGDDEYVSERYTKYGLSERVVYLDVPTSFLERLQKALPKFVSLLQKKPMSFFRALNPFKYGVNALSLKTLFWVEPFLGSDFDLVHCHFGPVANKYLVIREILAQKQKFITTFYGYDVSHIPKEKGAGYYTKLANVCSHFLVMSNDMLNRVVPLGIPIEKITVLPISVDVDELPFAQRSLKIGETVEIVSVGRFVEKKGFDDLLRAATILKTKSRQPFHISIIGGGALELTLRTMVKDLGLEDTVTFEGYLKIEDIIQLFLKKHIYVQPSKTATDGDME